MPLYKSIPMILMTFFSINVWAVDKVNTPDNDYNKIILDLAVTSLEDCYLLQHKTGVGLTQCMSETLRKVPNPYHYRLNISGDTPGHLDMILYNQSGYVINCYLDVHDKITVEHCVKYQVKPLNNNQELSITTPIDLKK